MALCCSTYKHSAVTSSQSPPPPPLLTSSRRTGGRTGSCWTSASPGSPPERSYSFVKLALIWGIAGYCQRFVLIFLNFNFNFFKILNLFSAENIAACLDHDGEGDLSKLTVCNVIVSIVRAGGCSVFCSALMPF